MAGRKKQKKYVSLKQAAARSGYVSDYIGQLARRKKIRAKKVSVNQAWLVHEDDVLSYRTQKSGTSGNISRWHIMRNGFGAQIPSFFKKDALVVLLVVLALVVGPVLLLTVPDFLLTAGIHIPLLRPNTSILYPATCLGDWQNLSNAQGELQLTRGRTTGFNKTNSAVFRADTGSVISCTDFQGEYPERIGIHSARLLLSLGVKGAADIGGLELAYSFDGSTWISLGAVREGNLLFSIPTITMIAETERIQFRLTGDISVLGEQVVYLDGMRMEIEFERFLLEADDLPKVRLKDSSITFISDRKDFRPNESPSFIIREPNLALSDIQSFIDEGEAEILVDRTGRLQKPYVRPAVGGGGGGGKGRTESIPAPVVVPDFVQDLIEEILPLVLPQKQDSPGKSENKGKPEDKGKVPSDKNQGKKQSWREGGIMASLFSLDIVRAQSSFVVSMDAVVLDWRGEKTDLFPQIVPVFENGQKQFEITVPSTGRSLSPGKYTLVVEAQTQDAILTSQQDFTWGVLAINVNKSIYAPGEEAYVQMGVLDDAGHTICDAQLTLVIKSPSGQESLFSVTDGNIRLSEECAKDSFTTTPDYFAYYQVLNEVGVYEMHLTAVTRNGTKSVVDGFEVRSSFPFDVERIGATRIYPPEQYPVTLLITANQDFEGIIEERVPTSFEISQPVYSTSYDSLKQAKGEQVIAWEVSLLEGEELQLGYRFDAPDISPEFYLLGPLEIGKFQEIRQWQIAADATATETLRPDGDVTATFPTCTEVTGGDCAIGHYKVVDEASLDTGDRVETGTAGLGGEEEEFTMTNPSLGGVLIAVTQVDVKFHAGVIACNGGGANCDALDVRIFIDTAYESVQQQVLTATPATYTLTFTGSWSTADDLQMEFVRVARGGGGAGSKDDDVRIYQVYADVTYTLVPSPPKLTQQAYIFENDDGTTGVDDNTAQAAGDTAIASVKKGERITLRIHLKNTGEGALREDLALFYDRSDDIWIKVKKVQQAITANGNCTDTNYDCITVDSSGDVGQHTSLAFAPDGIPWISYYDVGSTALKVAVYVGAGGDCFNGAWQCETVDRSVEPLTDTGQYSSIGFQLNGTAWISYYDATNTALKVATYVGGFTGSCPGIPSSWDCTTVDNTATTGQYTSIAFAVVNDAPWVSYYDAGSSTALKVANYVTTGGGCTSSAWDCVTVDNTGTDTGQYTSIAFDPDGSTWVSYYDVTNTALRVATKGGGFGSTCTDSGWTCGAADNDVGGSTDTGQYTSIAFAPDGNAWVSYYDATGANLALRVANYVSAGGGCTSSAWDCVTVDNTGTDTGQYTSIAFAPDGTAWVSYYDVTNTALRVANYVGSSGGCTSTAWDCGAVDNAAAVGQYSSLAFAPDGHAWVSYYDASSNNDLKIANIKRAGEIIMTPGVAGDNGDSVTKSHADMTSVTDTGNQGDADCITGGDNWNNGKWFESEEGREVSLPIGSSTAQCTEVAWVIDTSQAVASTTYRFVVASEDSFRKDKSHWRGPIAITQYPTLTIEASTTIRHSKDATPHFANCTDTAWGCEVIEATDVLGEFWIGLDFDSSGNPWVSYYNSTDTSIHLAQYVGSGGNCDAVGGSDAWNCTVVDNEATSTGSNTSVAIDSAGNIWISYRDSGNGNLKVATNYDHPDMSACTAAGWDCTTVDSSANVGGESSIAFDPNGNPWISYLDSTNLRLRVANFVGGTSGNCNDTAWNCTTVDETTSDVGDFSSIVISLTGKIWVSYFRSSDNVLRAATYVGVGGNCTDVAWDCETVDNIEGTPDNGRYQSMTLDANGDPWISYEDNVNPRTLKVAEYVGAGGDCTSSAWNCSDVEDNLRGGIDTSIAIDPAGNPWVFYFGSALSTDDYNVARYVGGSGGSCSNTAWDCTIVDNNGGADNVGEYGGDHAFRFDPSGVPWGAYQDVANSDIKIAKLHLPPYKNDSKYLLDIGKSARTDADGTCDSNTDNKGYCGTQTDDAHYDGITAIGASSAVSQRPLYTFAARNSNNIDEPTGTWVGKSTIAPSSNAIALEIYRFGTTDAWETVTLDTNTCSSAGANSDCTLAGDITASLSEYYEADGSNYWVFFRVWQTENSTGPETLKTDAFSVAFNSLAGGISISGTCTQYDQSTACVDDGSEEIKVAVNAVLQAQVDTAFTGTWSITGVTVANGDTVTVFINNATSGDQAVAVTEYDGTGNITGMKLIEHHLTIGSDDTGVSITNAELDKYTNATEGDSDVFHEVTTNTLTVNADGLFGDEELFVLTANTFAPAGNVNTHDIELETTTSVFTLGSSTIRVSGSWDNNGDFNADTGTVIFRASSGTETIDSTGASDADFNTFTLGETSGTATWTLSSALDVNGAMAIDFGTLGQGANNITLAGNLTINGSGNFTTGSGTFTFDGSGTSTWSNAATIDDLGEVTINGTSKTVNLTSSVKATKVTVEGDDILGLASAGFTLTLTGSGTGASRPFIINGTLTEGTNSKVAYTGTENTEVEDEVYHDVDLVPSSVGSPTYILGTATSQTVDVDGNLVVGDGTNPVTINWDTYDPVLNLAENLTLNASSTWTKSDSETLTFNGSATPVTWTDNNATKQDIGIVSIDGPKELDLGSSVTATKIDVTTGDTLDLQSTGYVLTLTGSGAGASRPFIVSGILSEGTNSTVKFTGISATDIEDETYWNLDFSPVSGTQTYTMNTGTIDVDGNLDMSGATALTVTAATNNPIIDVEGNVSINANATLTASSSAAFTVAGNFTDNGTFTANSGTVTFDTTGTSVIGGAGSPYVTFFNFTSIIPGKTLQFEIPATTEAIRIEGKFTAEGSSTTQIDIQSNSAGTQWLIDHQGTESVQYVDIKDSGCASGTTNISLDNTSTSVSNNGTCWLFPSLSFTLDAVSKSLDLNSGNTFTSTAATTLTVTARAEFGYELSAFETDNLRHTVDSLVTISDWTGTYESRTSWTGTCSGSGECGWGYNTDDADVGFGSDYAAFAPAMDAPGDIVAKSTAPVTDDVTTITYRTSVSVAQLAGPYQTIIRYIVTPRF